MDDAPDIHPETSPGALLPSCATVVEALPSELAFWALFHCRHARPPDSRLLR